MLTLDREPRATMTIPVLSATASALAADAAPSGSEPDTVWWLEAVSSADEIDCVHWLST